MTAAEREFRRLVDEKHIPQASALLDKVYAQALVDIEDGKTATSELFFKVCGLIRKPTDNAVVARLARELLDGMIAEAKARRQAGRPAIDGDE